MNTRNHETTSIIFAKFWNTVYISLRTGWPKIGTILYAHNEYLPIFIFSLTDSWVNLL